MYDETRFDDDVREVIEAVRQLAPRWAEGARLAEIEGAISSETAEELASTRVHQLIQPANFGGLEASLAAHSYAISVVGEVCASSAWCCAVWGAHNWMLAHWPEETQNEIWGPDPTARISASIVPKTSFASTPDTVDITGRFTFTSGCDHAHWYGAGGLIEGTKGPEGVIALFPADPSLIDHDSWRVAGLAGTGSKDLVVSDPIVVSRSRILSYADTMSRTSPGLGVNTSSLFRAPFRATAALVLAAPVIGAARGAVNRFVERSAHRPGPLTGHRIAEASALLSAADSLMMSASTELDRLGTVELSPIAAAAAHRDTAMCVRLAARATDVVFEASGGPALRDDEPIQRMWRDAHAARNHGILNWDTAATAYGAAINPS